MTKEELQVVIRITRRISKLEERIIRLKSLRTRITHEISDLPTPTGYQFSRIEEITVQIDEYERELNELRIERACLQAELVRLVEECVTDEIGKAIFVERYAFGKEFQEIARELSISEPHVYYLHRHGLKELVSKDNQ